MSNMVLRDASASKNTLCFGTTSKDVVNLPKLEEKVRIIGMFTIQNRAMPNFDWKSLVETVRRCLFSFNVSFFTFLFFHFPNLLALKERCESRKPWGRGSQHQEARDSEKVDLGSSFLFFWQQHNVWQCWHQASLYFVLTFSMCKFIGVRLWPSGAPWKTINSVTMFISRWMLKQQVLLRRLW